MRGCSPTGRVLTADSVVDTARLHEALGGQVRIVSLEEGLRETLAS